MGPLRWHPPYGNLHSVASATPSIRADAQVRRSVDVALAMTYVGQFGAEREHAHQISRWSGNMADCATMRPSVSSYTYVEPSIPIGGDGGGACRSGSTTRPFITSSNGRSSL
jgi:hypothetical protein